MISLLTIASLMVLSILVKEAAGNREPMGILSFGQGAVAGGGGGGSRGQDHCLQELTSVLFLFSKA